MTACREIALNARAGDTDTKRGNARTCGACREKKWKARVERAKKKTKHEKARVGLTEAKRLQSICGARGDEDRELTVSVTSKGAHPILSGKIPGI